MEEGVRERKNDKNEKNDEGKEVECPDDTPPDDTEEGVASTTLSIRQTRGCTK